MSEHSERMELFVSGIAETVGAFRRAQLACGRATCAVYGIADPPTPLQRDALGGPVTPRRGADGKPKVRRVE